MDRIVGKIDCIYDLRPILCTGQRTLKEIKARHEKHETNPDVASDSDYLSGSPNIE
jgi:hypothetical protein